MTRLENAEARVLKLLVTGWPTRSNPEALAARSGLITRETAAGLLSLRGRELIALQSEGYQLTEPALEALLKHLAKNLKENYRKPSRLRFHLQRKDRPLFSQKIDVVDAIDIAPASLWLDFLARYPSKREIDRAKSLFRYYESCRFARTSRFDPKHVRKWHEISETDRLCFIRAGRTSKEVHKSPSDYLNGIFWWYSKFDRTRKGRRKYILPQPNQLYGDQAKSKSEEHDVSRETDAHRIDPERASHKKFFGEKRKLKSLASILKLEPLLILKAMPNEFTPEFIRHQTRA